MIGVPRTGNHVLKFNIPADDSDTNAVSADRHSAIIPVSSGEKRAAAAGWTNGGSWLDQHKDINLIGQTKDVDLVFLGNSITQSWGGEGRHVWGPGQEARERYFGKVKTANFSISGDRTQHLLWRIENGNFDHISPEVIVLMIGTNNLNANSAIEIAEGIEAVVNKLRTTVPESKILLLGIFPRGEQPEDPFRQKIKNINESISHLNDDNHIFYRDIGKIFLYPDGAANKTLMSDDCLHLRPAGYEAWAKAIAPFLKQMGIDTK
jgi:beta-glucosidase